MEAGQTHKFEEIGLYDIQLQRQAVTALQGLAKNTKEL